MPEDVLRLQPEEGWSLMVSTGWQVGLPRMGGTWTVGALIGEGGQGSVHELHPLGGERKSLALKWYRPQAASPTQREAIARLTSRPAPSESFLWPLEVVDGPDGSFGYVMPLRPESYVPVTALLTGRVAAGFRTVARLAMGLADAFLQLHAQGLCYRDISLGNVFFDPGNGRALVCDNDNVGIDQGERARVLGTSRFMAPEIVRGDAQPSIATDLYSLAVLQFYLLMVHHPLVGRRELAFDFLDQAAEHELFGASPLFIFDPLDASNSPDPVVHATVMRYWSLYPSYVRTEFVSAFTVGLNDPARRVREGVWRSRMARLHDGILLCRCGAENPTEDGATSRCWSCDVESTAPVRLVVGGRTVVLNHDSKVVRHHLALDYDYDTAVATVHPHPTRPHVWGLRNDSDRRWRYTVDGQDVVDVEPGRTAGLVAGAHIDFGSVEGEILA